MIAKPVRGPATATPGAASVDPYFAPAGRAGFLLADRMLIHLAHLGGARSGAIELSASAILTEINGGEWVQLEAGPHSYERR